MNKYTLQQVQSFYTEELSYKLENIYHYSLNTLLMNIHQLGMTEDLDNYMKGLKDGSIQMAKEC